MKGKTMSLTIGTLEKAKGIGVCILPAKEATARTKKSSSKKRILNALEQRGGLSIEDELRRRGVSSEKGSVHILSITGESPLLGIIVGFWSDSSQPGASEDRLHPESSDEQSRWGFVRRLAIAASKQAKEWKAGDIAVHASVFQNDAVKESQVFYETLLLSQYAFDRYQDLPKKRRKGVSAPRVLFEKIKGLTLKHLSQVEGKVSGVNFARDLVNTPAGDLGPYDLARQAQSLRSGGSLQVKTLKVSELEKKKMNGILSVGRASKKPPAFITLRYQPTSQKRKKFPVIGLVGKGVTFDSGGLSIKTGTGMETMKCDMAGAAAVLGVFHALRSLRLPIEVRGYVPTAENMIHGNALRPGDVIQMMSGKTVEVLNTDAEGRLLLADALHYASKDGCDIIIDLATLTGACVVALGEECAGLYANNSELKGRLLCASGAAGERLWHMPLLQNYKKLLQSPIADIKNIGSRGGGSITAALFLEHFIGDVLWAHLDIAGPAFTTSGDEAGIKGGTGFGVRTILAYIEQLVSE